MNDDNLDKIPGIPDADLRPELHEAHRVLVKAQDDYRRALVQVEAYVRPLAQANDGDAPACADVQAQIAVFRSLYAIG